MVDTAKIKRGKMSIDLQKNRRRVILNIVAGCTLGIIIFSSGMYLFPAGDEREFPSKLENIVFTIKWQSLSVIMLLFGIERVGNVRFATNAIDPVYGKGEQLLYVEARYLQNTVEQLILSSTGQLILSVYVSAAVLTRIIPSLVVMFVIARILFFIGYKMDPMKRGLGFAMTFIPSVIVHMYCLFCFFWYK